MRDFERVRLAALVYFSLKLHQVMRRVLVELHVVQVVFGLRCSAFAFQLEELSKVLLIKIRVGNEPCDDVVGAHHL